MAATKIVVNRAGIRRILRGEEGDVVADLRRRATTIARAAGGGHRVEIERGRNRARAAVITDTFDARRAEAIDRNLTRAVDAGRA